LGIILGGRASLRMILRQNGTVSFSSKLGACSQRQGLNLKPKPTLQMVIFMFPGFNHQPAGDNR
jgi:hypothetical protein